LIDQPAGCSFGIDLKTAPRMCVAADPALRLRPAQHRQRPGRPVLAAIRSRIDLLFQVDQAHVTQCLGPEAGDFEGVFHERLRLASLVGQRGEELLLMIEPRTPGQHAADVQPLTFDLPEHVRGLHTLGGRRVVRTAGGVDVMVAAEVATR
jgi:hypothetical protein